MKERKRIRLDMKKLEKKKEWERIKQAQDFEKIYRLLYTHFDIEKRLVKSPDGIIRISIQDIMETLSCEECSHFKMECKGNNLRGRAIIECLLGDRHRYCESGIISEHDGNFE